MSERQILITVDQPDWDSEDWEYLLDTLNYAVNREAPADRYTIQEFEK